jgi:uncharacterized protein (TIRG00374 family)
MKGLERNLAVALALGAGVYLALALLSGVDDLRRALDRFEWTLVPVALTLVGLSYAVRYLRWSYYLRRLGVHVGRRADVAIFAAGLAMTISPGKLGEVLKSAFIFQVSGDPASKTAPAVLAERITDGVGMVVWGLLGALAFGFGPSVLVPFLGIMLAAALALRSRRLSILFKRSLGRVPGLGRLVPHVADFHGASNRLLAAGPLGVGSALSFGAWGLELLAVYLSVRGVDAVVPFLVVVFIFAVASIAGSLSLLPGGIGAAEASLAGMFVAVAGLASGQAAAVTLVIRLLTLWFAVLVGILGLAAVRRFVPRPKMSP